MNRKSVLSIFFILIIGIPLLAGCGGGGGGGSDTTVPTEQINQLLDNFEKAYQTGDVTLFKSCITDPCTYNNNPPTYHKDITDINTYVSFKYASRQIQKISSNKVNVTSVNVNKELADDYLEEYVNEVLEIVKVNGIWKITKISDLPFTPNSQDTTELNQLFDDFGQAMLADKNLNQLSNCVNYPFGQFSHPNETVFYSQTDLQYYLNSDLTYNTFDIDISNYHFIGSIDSEYIAKIEIITDQLGIYSNGTPCSRYIMADILLKKINNQWKIYKINGEILY